MDPLEPDAIAKRPVQSRARARFERVLEEAERLLSEAGLEGFSIPAIAERTGFTRGSVYSYFPTPHALLNELAKRYLAEIEALFVDEAARLERLSWRRAIERVTDQVNRYYNARPVARLLLLGGAVTDDSYRAQELTVRRLGDLGRKVLQRHGISLPARSPDVATLTVDIGVACLRRSVFENGHVVPAYRDAAARAMIAFLELYLRPAQRRGKR